MALSRDEMIDKLLKSYEAFYNINKFDDSDIDLVARCDYFEDASKYVLSQKAELWSTKSEEFAYIFSVDKLDKMTYEKCHEFAYSDGMSRINIGPNHMYSYITAIFLCDECDEETKKLLKKTRHYKSFHFSLHGWMDYHTACVSTSDESIIHNASGRMTAKILKKVLFHKNKKRRF